MVKDPGSALVRIAATESGSAIGSGFIFHQDPDGILILTCRDLVDPPDNSAGNRGAEVWIDQKYEADCIFGCGNPESNLAVLKCSAMKLDEREPLKLGRSLVL